MRRFLLIICTLLIFVIFCSSVTIAYEKEINSLSAGMAENITKAGRKTIAVVDFTDLQGNVTELGRFLAEEFSVDLASAGKGFEVVDRTHLKALLKEYKLSFSDLVNPESAKKLGQIAGVEAIITGTITPFGESVRLTIKILDVSTAKVIGASSGNIPRTQAINELLARGIEAGTQALDASTLTQTISTPKTTKAQQKIEFDNFLIELVECKTSGDKVNFTFLITNNGKDRELDLIRGEFPRIFDDSGNEYSTGRDYMYLGKEYFRNLLISGVPTKAGISFKNVTSDAKIITLLEISSSVGKIQFRNIPITK